MGFGVVLASPAICLPLHSLHPLRRRWSVSSTVASISVACFKVKHSLANRQKRRWPLDAVAIMVKLTISIAAAYSRLPLLLPSICPASSVDPHALACRLIIPVQTRYSHRIWAPWANRWCTRKVGLDLFLPCHALDSTFVLEMVYFDALLVRNPGAGS